MGKDTVFWDRELPGFGVRAYDTQIETTARYTHLALDSVHKSAARIADSIVTDILGEPWRQVYG